MKKYAMADWLKIHNETKDDGTTHITGANLKKDLTIDYLEVTTKITGCLTSYGGLVASNVQGIEGKKQFVLEDDGTISLVADCDESLKSFIKLPEVGFKNAKTIPLEKWLEDMKYHQKKAHKRNEEWYRRLKVLGCEVNGKGVIKSINVEVTYDHDYGSFGPIVSDHKVRPDDLLNFTYGMQRNDILDDWIGRYGKNDIKVYFNENFDLVFEDDGNYRVYAQELYAKV